MDIIRLLLLLTITSIIPGQLLRFHLGSNAALTLSDISAAITTLAFILFYFISNKKIKYPKTVSYMFLLFIFFALLSLILALNTVGASNVLIGSFFLIRFVLYFSLSIAAYNVILKSEILNWLKAFLIVGLVFSVIGIVQLISFPDLRLLSDLGWDPHINRLVSSLLDPNFSGGLMVLFFSLSACLYIFLKKKVYLAFSLLFIASIILTFSRSSYLALIAAIFLIGGVKSPRMLFSFLVILGLSLVLISKSRERILSAFTIDETAQSRIESWQNALTIFSKNYLFGVGFNTYRHVQAQEGNFSIDNPQGGNSGAGTDSSILLVAATTGIFGLFSFLLFILVITKNLIPNIKTDYAALISFSGLTATLLHSQFVNSLFYPQIMIALWIFIGVSLDKQQN